MSWIGLVVEGLGALVVMKINPWGSALTRILYSSSGFSCLYI